MANSDITRQYSTADKETPEYKAWVKAYKEYTIVAKAWTAMNKEWLDSGKKAKDPARPAKPVPPEKPVATGAYLARVRHIGETATQRFAKKSRAEKWVRDTVNAMDEGQYDHAAANNKVTVTNLIDEYIEHQRVMSKKSLWNELEYIDYYKTQPFSKKRFTRVRTAEIQAMINRMVVEPSGASHKRPLKWSTIRRRLTTLSAVFRYGMGHYTVSMSNPVTAAEWPSEDGSKEGDSGNRDRIFKDDDEEQQFFDAAKRYSNGYMYFLSKFAVETAIRKAELIGMEKKGRVGGKVVVVRKHEGLKWHMIKFDESIISLSAQITKGGKARDVPLSSAAIEVLEQLLEKLGRKPEPDEKVFPVTADAIKSAWARTIKRAGIEDFIFHDLRHVSCTRWSKHVTMLELMMLAGHSKPETTALYYSDSTQALAKKLASIEEGEKLASKKSVATKGTVECTCEQCGRINIVDIEKAALEKVMSMLMR